MTTTTKTTKRKRTATDEPPRRRRARVESEVGAEAEHGAPTARVWCESKVTINLGNYESVGLTLGTSRSCDDTRTAIKTMQTQMMRDHEGLLGPKIDEIRGMWGNTE